MPSTESPLEAFDDGGFLADVRAWSHDLARQIAAEHGIASLTQAHWAVICYLRRHHLRGGTLPWDMSASGRHPPFAAWPAGPLRRRRWCQESFQRSAESDLTRDNSRVAAQMVTVGRQDVADGPDSTRHSVNCRP